jgi:hypothetical protein
MISKRAQERRPKLPNADALPIGLLARSNLQIPVFSPARDVRDDQSDIPKFVSGRDATAAALHVWGVAGGGSRRCAPARHAAKAELRSLTNGLPSRINVCTRRKRSCGPQGGSPGTGPNRKTIAHFETYRF